MIKKEEKGKMLDTMLVAALAQEQKSRCWENI